MTPLALDTLARDFATGSPRALARLISTVENDPTRAPEVFANLPPAGRATVVGLTGAPGSGKSTIASALVAALRAKGERVALIAVDPSSPFRGGALLGDRIRMSEHAADQGVFIRSMATRGMLGGLAAATWQTVTLLERFGFPWVLVETVGVGQSEVDIARLADVTVLLLAPGMGDGIQVMKAGVMEIGDVFVVNKADRDGAERTLKELTNHLNHSPEPKETRPEVLTTIATERRGITELLTAITSRAAVQGPQRRQSRLRHELDTLLSGMLRERVDRVLAGDVGAALWHQLETGKLDSYSVAAQLLHHLRGE